MEQFTPNSNNPNVNIKFTQQSESESKKVDLNSIDIDSLPENIRKALIAANPELRLKKEQEERLIQQRFETEHNKNKMFNRDVLDRHNYNISKTSYDIDGFSFEITVQSNI